MEQIVNRAIVTEEGKCQKDILGGARIYLGITQNTFISGQNLVSEQ